MGYPTQLLELEALPQRLEVMDNQHDSIRSYMLETMGERGVLTASPEGTARRRVALYAASLFASLVDGKGTGMREVKKGRCRSADVKHMGRKKSIQIIYITCTHIPHT